MKRLALAILIFVSSTLTSIYSVDSVYDVRAWEVSVDSAIKEYGLGSEYTPINVSLLKDYDNRIFNLVVSVNSEIRNKMQLLRSNKKPIRDLLFIDGKLCEIMESHEAIDDITFKTIFVSMKNSYGFPEMKKEKELTIYTFKNEKTHAILIVHPIGNVSNARIYFYTQSLFRMLFSD